MKKETIKYIIQLIVAILTAIGSTLSVTTAASGAPAEGVALLGGTIVGTGWLHHMSTLVYWSLREKFIKNLIQNLTNYYSHRFDLRSSLLTLGKADASIALLSLNRSLHGSL